MLVAFACIDCFEAVKHSPLYKRVVPCGDVGGGLGAVAPAVGLEGAQHAFGVASPTTSISSSSSSCVVAAAGAVAVVVVEAAGACLMAKKWKAYPWPEQ